MPSTAGKRTHGLQIIRNPRMDASSRFGGDFDVVDADAIGRLFPVKFHLENPSTNFFVVFYACWQRANSSRKNMTVRPIALSIMSFKLVTWMALCFDSETGSPCPLMW
jgi:hypothetical protein